VERTGRRPRIEDFPGDGAQSVKSVFAKTDTHRQSELVALLLQVE
jgi:hypothetical protein